MVDPFSAAALGSGLVTYNRQNWMWDKTLGQKREYQGQLMNIKRFELFREDVRDLAELTISKMDNYLLINILLMGFCVKIFTEGRPKPHCSPSWLHWLYAATNAGALLYFILSVWLAMHASIASHSFEVRLLTQFVRLPIPSKQQIDAARFYAQDFENKRAKDLFRIPVLSEMLRKHTDTMNNLTSKEPSSSGAAAASQQPSQLPRARTSVTFNQLPHRNSTISGVSQGSVLDHEDVRIGGALTANAALETEAARCQHVKLYREVQSNWQAYDAYARVSMAMGVNQLMLGMSYYCLIMFVGENEVTWPALCCTLSFAGCAYLIARLDLFTSRWILRRAGMMMVVPPMMSFVNMLFDKAEIEHPIRRVFDAWIPVIFLLHVYWIHFILGMTKAETREGMSLPVNWRSVLFLDVYGWIRQSSSSGDSAAQAPRRERRACPEVRGNLASWARTKSVQIDRELCLWETPGILEITIPEQAAVFNDLRRQFNTLQDILRDRLRRAGFLDLLNRDIPNEHADSDIWLKLLVSQNGRVNALFKRHCLDEVRAKPPRGAPISDLDALIKDIDFFEGKVSQLVRLLDSSAEASRDSRLPAGPRPGESFAAAGGSGGTAAAAASSVAAAASSSSAAAAASSSSAPGSAGRHPGDGGDGGINPSSRAGAGAGAGAGSSAAAGARPSAVLRRPGSTAQSDQTSLSSVQHWHRPEAHEEEGNPAQETRFGGREAVELSSEFTSNLLGTGANAAQTFLPGRFREEEGDCELRRTLQRPPGQFPWHLFLQGSLFLMGIWIVGFVWCVLEYSVGLDISLRPAEPGLSLEVRSPRGPHRVLAFSEFSAESGDLPPDLSEHFVPEAMACRVLPRRTEHHRHHNEQREDHDHDEEHRRYERDEDLRGVSPEGTYEVLLLERYNVHALLLQGSRVLESSDWSLNGYPGSQDWSLNGRWHHDSSIRRCLHSHPEFRDEGVASISITCAPRGSNNNNTTSNNNNNNSNNANSHSAEACAAQFLSIRGDEVLNCPFEGAPGQPAASRLFGGPYSSLTSLPKASKSPSQSDQNSKFSELFGPAEEAAWGLRADGKALLELRSSVASFATSPNWVPRYSLLDSDRMSKSSKNPKNSQEILGNLTSLQAIEVPGSLGTALLGLDIRGRLHAWHVQSGLHRSWILPRRVRWNGLCEVDGQLLLLSSDKTNRLQGISSSALWRTEIPPDFVAELEKKIGSFHLFEG